MTIEGIIAMLFMSLALVSISIFIFKIYLKEKSIYKNYKKTIGICVDWDKYVKFENGAISYDLTEARNSNAIGVYRQPIVVYKVDGREYQITGKVGHGPSIFRLKGRRFKVRYNPENPYDAILSDDTSFFIFQ